VQPKPTISNIHHQAQAISCQANNLSVELP
jgi:hypothetical protein